MVTAFFKPFLPEDREERKLMFFIGLLVVLGGFLFAIILRDVYTFGVDDSYIFFRYAENIAGGHGIVFNPGEPAGEGFTSWIWLLFLAFFQFIGVNIITASKIPGILFHLTGGIFIYILTIKLLGKDWISKLTAVILTLVFCLNYRLIAHSVSGMETSLYVFSIILLIYLTTLALLAQPGEKHWWLIIAITAAGVFFIRPEGIAAGGISLMALAIKQWRNLLEPKTWFYVFIGLILPLALFITWKLVVFGYPFPHSYYHKLIVITSEYKDALRQLLLFFKSYWWLLILAFAITTYTIVKHKKYLFLYYPLLFILMVMVYQLFYPAMNYLHRFYIPYWPLLLIMFSPGIYLLIKIIYRFKFAGFSVFLVLVLCAGLVWGINFNLKELRSKVRSWAKIIDPRVSRAKLGMLMNRLPTDVIAANTEMGVIPFYSGLTCIDMAGLTDPYLAHNRLSMTYLKKRKVDLILFPADAKNMSVQDWNKYTHPYGDVFLSKEFKENFEPVGWHSRYFLFADKTSTKFTAIKTWGGKCLYPGPIKNKR